MLNSITFLHKRNEINNLLQKEKRELLDQLIDAELELFPNEINLLNKEQLKKYTNKEFDAMCWISPQEWKASDETQKELYAYNRQRAAFTPEVFDSMSKEWRKNILMAINVLSGYFLNKEDFEKLSNSEKKYYVNKKLIKSSSFYPWEIPFLTLINLKKIIDQKLLKNDAEDFTTEQLKEFSPEAMNYYKKQKNKAMKINESIRNYIRTIVNEIVSSPGTVFGPYSDEITISKKEFKQPQYFGVALKRANNVCTNPEKTPEKLDCPVNYEIEKTFHSFERQFRHDGDVIEDYELQNTFDKAIEKIVKLYLANSLEKNDKIHIKNVKTNLNIIANIVPEKITNDESIVNFPIITVMRKKDFIPGYDTKKTIFV